MKVSLFATCLGDQFYADACADAVRLLLYAGVDVDVPQSQTCCGQPAYNTGRRPEAIRMARQTLDTFGSADYLVLPSGSCAGMIRCFYPDLMNNDLERAQALADRTYELSHFLVEVLGIQDLGSGLTGKTIAYHHSCHALRELGVSNQPISLLKNCGAEVVTWGADEECCGFGGLFSAKLPEVSAAMADRKLDTLPDVDFVTSTDGGCLLQLSGRGNRRRLPIQFRHFASLLWDGVSS